MKPKIKFQFQIMIAIIVILSTSLVLTNCTEEERTDIKPVAVTLINNTASTVYVNKEDSFKSGERIWAKRGKKGILYVVYDYTYPVSNNHRYVLCTVK